MKNALLSAITVLSSLAPHTLADGVVCNNELILGSAQIGPFADLEFAFYHKGFWHASSIGDTSSFVLDVRDPDNITTHSSRYLGYGPKIIVGDYFYSNETDQILDISDMTNISIAGFIPFSLPSVYYAFTYNNVLYGIDFGNSTLHAIDATDPLKPKDTGNFVQNYIADDTLTLKNNPISVGIDISSRTVTLLDLTVPTAPMLLGTTELPDSVPNNFSNFYWALSEDRLFVYSEPNHMLVYNISDNAPYLNLQNTIDLRSDMNRIRIYNNRVWVEYQDSFVLDMFSISPDGTTLTKVSEFAADSLPTWDFNGVAMFSRNLPSIPSGSPRYLYYLVDTRVPHESPYIWESAGTLSFTGGILTNDRMYVSNPNTDSIEIYKLDGTNDPELLGTYTSGSHHYDIQYSDDSILYATILGTSQLVILDVSDPQNPTLINELNPIDPKATHQFIESISFKGPIGYFLTQSVLTMIDFSDPTAPVDLGEIDIPNASRHYSLSITNPDYLTLSSLWLGHLIFDITDPRSPIFQSSISRPFPGIHAVVGDHFYVQEDFSSKHDTGIRVYDISDPTSPVRMQSISGYTGFPSSLQVDGNRLFLATHAHFQGSEGSMTVYDISDPSDPQTMYSYNQPLRTYSEGTYTASYKNNRVIVTGSASPSSSNTKLIDLSESCNNCSSDLNLDTTRTVDDVYLFLDLYHARDPFADYTRDGIFNFLDISRYIQSFQESCD